MDHALVAWIEDIPIVTRFWAGAIFLTSVLLSADIVSPIKLIFLPDTIIKKWEPWRLVTPFVCFGHFDMHVLMQLYNITQHSRQLESGYTSPFLYLWLIFLNMTLLLILAFWNAEPAWLGPPLLDALLYCWGRKNPEAQLSVLGLFAFPATYYAVLCLTQTFLFRQSIGFSDLAGLVVGHFVFYFEEVFEKVHGFNPLQAPWLWLEAPLVQLEDDGTELAAPREDPIQARGELQPDPMIEEAPQNDEEMILID